MKKEIIQTGAAFVKFQQVLDNSGNQINTKKASDLLHEVCRSLEYDPDDLIYDWVEECQDY